MRSLGSPSLFRESGSPASAPVLDQTNSLVATAEPCSIAGSVPRARRSLAHCARRPLRHVDPLGDEETLVQVGPRGLG